MLVEVRILLFIYIILLNSASTQCQDIKDEKKCIDSCEWKDKKCKDICKNLKKDECSMVCTWIEDHCGAKRDTCFTPEVYKECKKANKNDCDENNCQWYEHQCENKISPIICNVCDNQDECDVRKGCFWRNTNQCVIVNSCTDINSNTVCKLNDCNWKEDFCDIVEATCPTDFELNKCKSQTKQSDCEDKKCSWHTTQCRDNSLEIKCSLCDYDKCLNLKGCMWNDDVCVNLTKCKEAKNKHSCQVNGCWWNKPVCVISEDEVDAKICSLIVNTHDCEQQKCKWNEDFCRDTTKCDGIDCKNCDSTQGCCWQKHECVEKDTCDTDSFANKYTYCGVFILYSILIVY
ncbi:hypothetical protein A3Q56_00547 [Intoshia linei]|uniref:Uncharacterized protein n=1 Tax=Intoshia linei TaxID=1819745 RepID=A0A177BDF9_9BILA|nr:hypothetical protein A3Q56_00547 [Intoshia linei]